ncbi:MAG: hypothetical protein ACRESK_08300, partial [Gammaproteobacteria bacterium]
DAGHGCHIAAQSQGASAIIQEVSIMGLLDEFTKDVTIKRQVITNTDAMGSSKAYTAAARGGLPTTGKCRVMKASARERFQYGVNDEDATDYLLFTTNPQVDNRDQVTIDGASRTLNVLTLTNVQELDRLWIASCQESSRGVK